MTRAYPPQAKRPHRIGGRVREICTLVERLGACSPRQIREGAPHLSAKAVNVYCKRAVDHGLLTRKDGKYHAVPEWQEITSDPEAAPSSQGIYPNGPMPIASVWDLGARVPATLAGVWA